MNNVLLLFQQTHILYAYFNFHIHHTPIQFTGNKKPKN